MDSSQNKPKSSIFRPVNWIQRNSGCFLKEVDGYDRSRIGGNDQKINLARELENAIERAIVLGTDERILPEDLPDTLLEVPSAASVPITRYHEGVAEAKKQLILRAVEQVGGSYTEAAKLLGVRATYLHRLMRNLNLKSTQPT
jgi:hypothetical protein